jgi:hypothetical protein
VGASVDGVLIKVEVDLDETIKQRIPSKERGKEKVKEEALGRRKNSGERTVASKVLQEAGRCL